MSNINTEGLPIEMQARIADIIEKAKSNAIQPVGQQAPATCCTTCTCCASTFTDGSHHCFTARGS